VTPTRREFIKNVGIAIGSLMAVRCIPAVPTRPAATSTPAPTPTTSKDDSPRDRLREAWSRLDWLAEEASDWDDYERGEEARDKLVADHRTALDELVAASELDADVADQVQEAFSEAAYHVWRANCGMTCYEPMAGPDYTPASSSQLAQQAQLLAEMAASGDLDQDTVAQAQTAIERDIAFLNLSNAETQTLYEELMAAAGDSYNYPPFDELDLGITPEAAKAARFLVELLLEE